ncbi:unnamed protein product [Symbiodinium pilosum]|uniref:Uncharacterized protein n=1 Tax=Symbiodinium pilosum TaxID=2952 RepID=A0A812S363_SYMPI|nr:unnamed protein product [Symbiodinium pilosum]
MDLAWDRGCCTSISHNGLGWQSDVCLRWLEWRDRYELQRSMDISHNDIYHHHDRDVDIQHDLLNFLHVDVIIFHHKCLNLINLFIIDPQHIHHIHHILNNCHINIIKYLRVIICHNDSFPNNLLDQDNFCYCQLYQYFDYH